VWAPAESGASLLGLGPALLRMLLGKAAFDAFYLRFPTVETNTSAPSTAVDPSAILAMLGAPATGLEFLTNLGQAARVSRHDGTGGRPPYHMCLAVCHRVH
jgi:hypothetical protein